jgi:carbon monoxide dehydrogenase subunit G
MRIAVTHLFTCSPETLWAHIEEPEKQKRWMKGLLSNEPTSPGARGVGSTFRMRIKEGRKAADYDGEVTAHDAPRHLEVVMGGGNFPKGMTMRVEYRLTAQGGQTRLDYVCKAEMPKAGVFMKLMFVVFRLFGRMQLRGFMRALRKQVEEPTRAAA